MNKVSKTTREKWFEPPLTLIVGGAMTHIALSVEQWFRVEGRAVFV